MTNAVRPRRRRRRSPWTAGFLDGVTLASIGPIAAVAWTLAEAALVDALTVLLAAGVALLLIRFKVNSAWLVLAGGALGLLVKGLFS